MGQVFLGYSPAGRPVAVKIIHHELAADPVFRTRFRREVAAATSVSGAYTAPVTAAGPDDDPPWLATSFVPGPSLADAVAEGGPLPAASVWKLAAGLVEALQAVHACGLVHRDLKPANVMLALDGPRVIDFGISRALKSTQMTSTGLIVGTPAFMSPEQADGARVGVPSDVFSLGCVIVFAATGVGPFGDGPPASMLYRIVHAEPALGQMPDGLRELAAACLVKAPEERPSLAELVDMIAAGRAAEEEDTGLASFWPAGVAGLIRTFQVRLNSEIPEAPRPSAPSAQPAGVVAQPVGTVTSATVAQAPGAPPVATAALPETARAGNLYGTRPVTAPPEPDAAWAAGFVSGGRPAPGRGAQTDAVAAGHAGAAPGLPGDLPGWTAGRGGQPESGVTRRRALFSAVGVAAAAGLAVAGWELTRGGGSPSAAGPASKKGSTPAAKANAAVPRGGRIWSFATTQYVQSGIAVANGVVYAGSNDGSVYALDAAHGHRIWAFPTGGAIQSGIAVADGAVYAGSADHNVYAVRASNGHRIWTSPVGGFMSSGIAVANGAVYGGCIGLPAFALRTSNGGKIWTIGPGNSPQGVVVSGDVLYVGSTASGVSALHSGNGGTIWDSPTEGPVASGIALGPGAVYAGSYDKNVYGLSTGNGDKLWVFPAGNQVNSGIAVAGGVVCAGTDDGYVYGLSAARGHQLWRFRAGGRVDSGIAMANGVVYFGSWDNKVYALQASNGHKIWEYTTGGTVSSGIVVANRVVYVGSDDYKIYALRA
jgi:outer membrane protein assembly factor BamB